MDEPYLEVIDSTEKMVKVKELIDWNSLSRQQQFIVSNIINFGKSLVNLPMIGKISSVNRFVWKLYLSH